MQRIFLDAKSDPAQRSFMNMAARAAFHLGCGRIGSISIFTGRLYGLMAARTQTSPGGFMAPAAALWLGGMSSPDCTSGTGGRRTWAGSGRRQQGRRLTDAPNHQTARKQVPVAAKAFICVICVVSGH